MMDPHAASIDIRRAIKRARRYPPRGRTDPAEQTSTGYNVPLHEMLTEADFRRIALGMKDATEMSHMGHPDFRAQGRIFATLHGDHLYGMVKLTPDQQQEFVRAHPRAFAPESGAWGRQGCTRVRLDAIDEETLGEAMTLAWQNLARKAVTLRPKTGRSSKPIQPPRKR